MSVWRERELQGSGRGKEEREKMLLLFNNPLDRFGKLDGGGSGRNDNFVCQNVKQNSLIFVPCWTCPTSKS